MPIRSIYPVDNRGLAYSYAYIGIKRLGVGQFYLDLDPGQRWRSL